MCVVKKKIEVKKLQIKKLEIWNFLRYLFSDNRKNRARTWAHQSWNLKNWNIKFIPRDISVEFDSLIWVIIMICLWCQFQLVCDEAKYEVGISVKQNVLMWCDPKLIDVITKINEKQIECVVFECRICDGFCSCCCCWKLESKIFVNQNVIFLLNLTCFVILEWMQIV